MEKVFKKYIILFSLIIVLTSPYLVLAANPALDTLDNVGSTEGPYNKPADDSIPLMDVIGTIIGVALSLIGVVFLVLMILAGYNWMSAQGDEEKVTKAKETIMRAIIGIVIVVGAYGIWAFVFSKLF
jgi:hypothetical protein